MSFLRELLPRASRAAGEEGYRRRQLLWFTWIRLAVITTALVTTLLLDFVIRPERVGMDHVEPLYAVLLAGYVLAAASLVALALTRSDQLLAAIQFAGDLALETGLFFVFVPVLDYSGAVAVVLPLFVLTTALACTYLDRVQGAVFATGAFLLQVAAHLLPRALPQDRLGPAARQLADAPPSQVAVMLFVVMFTFHATAWLLASRAERLRAMGRRLQSVSADLAELQAFNELVVRSVSAALVTTDPEGHLTFANDAARRLLGSAAAAASLHEILGWDVQEDEDLRAVLSGRVARRFVREAMLGGSRRTLEVAVSRLEDRDGRALGLLFLIEDRTELRELEQEVRLKEKLAVVGEMAAGIAHEIRNPLASISGSVQILHRQLRLSAEQEKLMRIVLEEARRLDGTIRDFLDYARPREPQMRTADLAELARETLLLLRHGDSIRPDHVVTGPDPASGPVPAACDPDQVRQVVWNLCQNGLKAMPDGGRLTVTAELAGTDACLRVADTGVGMSDDMRAHAFEPLRGEFAQGTGLGLAIVYRIVQDHGGRVALSSRKGAGTEVEIRLPAARVAA